MVHDTHFPHAPLGASSFLETSSTPTFDELEAQAKAMETKMRHDIQNLHPDTPSLTEPPIGASSFLQESPSDVAEDAEMEREAKLGAKVSWDDLERSVKATEAKTAADLEMEREAKLGAKVSWDDLERSVKA